MSWRPGRLAIRTWLLFAATYGALMGIVFFWASEPVERYCTVWTAKTTAWAFWLLGAHGRAEGNVVISSVSAFRVITECTAVYPAVILVSAIVAHPASWKHRLLGGGLGIPALVLVNLIRLLSLSFIEHWFPNMGEAPHLIVGQSLMVFFTVLFWLVWAAWSTSPR